MYKKVNLAAQTRGRASKKHGKSYPVHCRAPPGSRAPRSPEPSLSPTQKVLRTLHGPAWGTWAAEVFARGWGDMLARGPDRRRGCTATASASEPSAGTAVKPAAYERARGPNVCRWLADTASVHFAPAGRLAPGPGSGSHTIRGDGARRSWHQVGVAAHLVCGSAPTDTTEKAFDW